LNAGPASVERSWISFGPASRWDNCFIESFNARLRDECFNANVFTSLADARRGR